MLRLNKRRDGTISMMLRERLTKQSKEKDTYISKKKSLLITGIEGAGKSKYIKRIWNKRKDIYRHHKDSFLFLNAHETISDYFLNIADELIENGKIESSKGLTTTAKIEYITEYAKDGILIIDNLHKFSGRKLELIKELMRNCKLFVATTKDLRLINQTIQKDMAFKYEELNLKSTESKDATNIIIFAFIIFLFISGQPELALLVLLIKVGSRGFIGK